MITTRAPLPEECDAITELCLRSKAYWGYDADFIARCRGELTVTPASLADNFCRVALEGDTIYGFVEVSIDGDSAELEKLFVDVGAMGMGTGRTLFELARNHAVRSGAHRMTIAADPGAESFYAHQGAKTVGTVSSGSIKGRNLPLMELKLA